MNAAGPELTRDIEAVLERYLDIQDEEQKLKEEKSRLQDKLKTHMSPTGCPKWFAEAGGQKLAVVYREKTEIEYNEDLLRDRLGDRYVSILGPDLRKLRAALPRIAPYLDPVMSQIGSPDPEKVRVAIESGTMRKEDFENAFVKRQRGTVAVTRVREETAKG